MSDTSEKPASKIDLSPIGSNMGGSPKSMYTFFLLSLCRNYFEEMRAGDNPGIERATAALIAFCPSRTKRDQLWELYIKKREGANATTASVHAVGEMVSYLNDMLEFEEKSNGGLM